MNNAHGKDDKGPENVCCNKIAQCEVENRPPDTDGAADFVPRLYMGGDNDENDSPHAKAFDAIGGFPASRTTNEQGGSGFGELRRIHECIILAKCHS